MKIDYFKLLRESALFAWKYKILWIYGFFLALLGGGLNYNSNANFRGTRTEKFPVNFNTDMHRSLTWLEEITKSSIFWIIILFLIIIGLLLIVIIWYVTRVSKISLMKAVIFDESGEKEEIRFLNLWKKSHKFLVKFLVYDILWLFIQLPFIIFLVILIGFGFVTFQFGIVAILCITVPFILCFFILARILKGIGERLLVVRGSKVIECIKSSFNLFFENISKFTVAWLCALIPGCVVSLIFFFILMISVFPIILVTTTLLLLTPATQIIGIALLIFGIFITMLISSLLQSPFVVFKETYWTKFISQIINTV